VSFADYPLADPSSPHLARIRAEVRINMAMSTGWFGDVHHFYGIDILPSPHGGQLPIPGDRRTARLHLRPGVEPADRGGDSGCAVRRDRELRSPPAVAT